MPVRSEFPSGPENSDGSAERRDALKPGTRLEGYEVEETIGSGGFGIVYRARHEALASVVAIKEYIPAELAVREGDAVRPRSEDCTGPFAEGMRRFEDEAKRLDELKRHPAIVGCRGFFKSNGTAYLVMDYVDGKPLSLLLRDREKAGQPFTYEDLLAVMEPLLDGVAWLHGADMLHRDIKPSNILIRRSDEQPVLIDFGAAKQGVAERTNSSAPFTEGYAAPEQMADGCLRPWTDIYGLGATMWRMVAGANVGPDEERPRPASADKRQYAVFRGQSDPLRSARWLGAGKFPPHVLNAIDRCMTLDESRRWSNCSALGRELAGRGVPVVERERQAPRPPPVRPDAASAARGQILGSVLSILAAGIAAGALLLALLDLTIDREPGASAPPPASFRIEAIPPDASVEFEGADTPYRAGMTLEAGTYQVRVSAPGYEPDSRVIAHGEGPTSERIELKKRALGAPRRPSPQQPAKGPKTSAGTEREPNKRIYSSAEVTRVPRVRHQVDADYSDIARRARHQGTVVLAIEIWQDGSPHNVRVTRSLGLGLDEKAIEAVQAWRFDPALKDGVAVRCTAEVEVNFRLPPAGPAGGQGGAQTSAPGHPPVLGATPPELLSKVEPAYTDQAKTAQLQGTVILEFEVWEDGEAHSIRVAEGLGMGLDENAIEAVGQWKFAPATKDGVPVRVAAKAMVSFRLL